MTEPLNRNGRVGMRRSTRARRAGLLAGLVVLCAACSTQRIRAVDVESVLRTDVDATVQQRLVVLGVEDCPTIGQLGVLLDPTTIATPVQLDEPDDLIRSRSAAGDARPVRQPTSHRSTVDDSSDTIVHYTLSQPFEGAPEDPIGLAGSPRRSRSVTLAWVSRGEVNTVPAPIYTTSSPDLVTIDRAQLSFDTQTPVAVIDSTAGVVGWLATQPKEGSTNRFAVLPLDGQSDGVALKSTRDSSCPATQLAALAADPSLGKVELPALPPPNTTGQEAALPEPSTLTLSANAVDTEGKPCPTGSVTVSFDWYTVAEPPTEPDGMWRIFASMTVTNNTTARLLADGGLTVPIVTNRGDDALRGGDGGWIAPGGTIRAPLRTHVFGTLKEIRPVDLEASILSLLEADGCI